MVGWRIGQFEDVFRVEHRDFPAMLDDQLEVSFLHWLISRKLINRSVRRFICRPFGWINGEIWVNCNISPTCIEGEIVTHRWTKSTETKKHFSRHLKTKQKMHWFSMVSLSNSYQGDPHKNLSPKGKDPQNHFFFRPLAPSASAVDPRSPPLARVWDWPPEWGGWKVFGHKFFKDCFTNRHFVGSIKNWMGPYQRTPRYFARAIRYSGSGVRSVGPVGDFLDRGLSS